MELLLHYKEPITVKHSKYKAVHPDLIHADEIMDTFHPQTGELIPEAVGSKHAKLGVSSYPFSKSLISLWKAN